MTLKEDESNYDEFLNGMSEQVLSIFNEMGKVAIDNDFTYKILDEFLEKLEPHGYTFDYYLDALPYNFRTV